MSSALYTSPVLGAWCQASGEDWTTYTNHGFVKGLGDGSLPTACFHHYMIQDYIFLVHFTRAWALAVVKSETLEEMKIAATMVDTLVNVEMQLHVETCRKIGITENQLFSAEETFENLAYTRFVMDSGLAGDFLDMMAALAPCVFGYGVIGRTIGPSAAADTPYQEWIDVYASEEYQGLCHGLGSMVEKAARARLGSKPADNPRWATLCKRFRTATRLEIDFWQMALRGH